ncbi:MAG: TIGR02710 family CRISPR-associated protein [Magnetococcales bacterium]|nr:TIGR02710 family CRISPR-associated protein [Magnetococcales bacterium]
MPRQSSNRPGILLLTVGTGNGQQREETLYRPLRRSIRQGEHQRVILLPSRVSETWAREVERDLADLQVAVQPLPEAGDEDDPDRCFAHFDRVLGQLLHGESLTPDQVEIDLTRGTKVMSAALALAALRHEIFRMRYITGQRDHQGMVIAGTETVQRFQAARITAARRLDQARQLMGHGQFAAVRTLLSDPDADGAGLWPDPFPDQVRAIRHLADFFQRWDRLDYAGAAAVLPLPARELLPEAWRRFLPDDLCRDWVRSLARPLPDRGDPDYCRAMAGHVSRLMTDLWANARRRLAAGQWEDAAVRAYRVLEMAGQVGLFRRGHDSGRLDPRDPVVAGFVARVENKGATPLGRNRDETLQAPREKAARLLKSMGDPLGGILLGLAREEEGFNVTLRNHSILIHGFQAMAPAEEQGLRDYLARLATELLCPLLGDDAAAWQTVARVPEFGE